MKVGAIEIGLGAVLAYLLTREVKTAADSVAGNLTVTGFKLGEFAVGPAGLRAVLRLSLRNSGTIGVPLDQVTGTLYYLKATAGTGPVVNVKVENVKIADVSLQSPVTVRGGGAETTVPIRVDIPTWQLPTDIVRIIQSGIFGGKLIFDGRIGYGNVSFPVKRDVYSF